MPDQSRVYTRDFIFLNAAVFLAFANVSVFFYFHDYLKGRPGLGASAGIIIGVFSLAALVVRPVVSQRLHAGNAKPWALAGVGGLIAALLAYDLAGGFWSLILLRLFHGAAYAVATAATLALMMSTIPQGRSGQAFGVMSLATLLPFALIPPLLPGLIRALDGFGNVLILFALFTLLAGPLIWRFRAGTGGGQAQVGERPTIREAWAGLKTRPVALTLAAMTLFFSGYAVIFFFLPGRARELGIAGPGVFFTLSSLGEIGVRLLARPWFDRLPKASLLFWGLVAAGLGYLALTVSLSPVLFYSLGGGLGIVWGFLWPVLTAHLFDLTRPRLRTLNTNLGLVTYQVGFFLGPALGGWWLQQGGYAVLYSAGAAFTLLAAGLVRRTGQRGEA